ncbi:MAG: T9SS type A sorting domain-containing protein [Bacteroidales bacterium]|nr:T9SS type A sorting domain-containing protein [Bacteroidales bacterium]
MKITSIKFMLILVITMITVPSFCQNASGSYNNYHVYNRQMDAFYKSKKENAPENTKIQGLKNYERQRNFWRTRVHGNDTVHDSYSKYAEQLLLYSRNLSLIPEKSKDNTWEFLGPINVSSHNQGIIVSLYINPDNINNIYAGTGASGMFRTTDGGQHWENVTDNIPMPGIGVIDIAVNPLDSATIYISTGNALNNYGAGIYKTTDDCQTWQQIMPFNPNERKLVRKLLINPQNPFMIFALVNKYVYRSVDGGINWEIIFDQLEFDPDWWDKNKYLVNIEFKPDDYNTVYISSVGIKTSYNPNHFMCAELWKTHNAQDTSVIWQRIEEGLPDFSQRFGITTSLLEPGKLYISYQTSIPNQNEVSYYLKSADYPDYTINDVFGKENFLPSYNQSYSGLSYYSMEFEISPVNPSIMLLGGYNLEVLDLNTGVTQFYRVDTESYPDFHVDQRVFKMVASDGKPYLFCGNDGGVSRYDYENNRMISLNGTGLDNLQYFGIGNSEVMPGFVIGGLQDNGEIGNGTGSWIRTNVADGYDNIIDPVDPRFVYATNNAGAKTVKRSKDYGISFQSINNGLNTDDGLDNRPFIMSPFDRNTLFIGYHEVYKTTNASDTTTSPGTKWHQFTDFNGLGYHVTSAIGAIALSPADSNVMYVGYDGATWAPSGIASRLFKTTDGGDTWVDLTSGIDTIVRDHGITGIKISGLDPDKVWLSFGGFQDRNGVAVNRVIYSEDGGNNWTDITVNLPNLPVNCLQGIIMDNDYKMMAGTDLGVFIFDDQQFNWINISNGLPYTIVTDIEVNYNASELRVATFGRGIWKSSIPFSLFNNEALSVGQSKEIANSIKLYPNPAETWLTVEIPQTFNMINARMQVLDANGRTVIDQKPDSHLVQLDIHRLMAGLYVLKLMNNEAFAAKRFVIR